MSGNIRVEPWNYSCDDCESVEGRYPCPLSNCSKHGDEPIRRVHGGSCNGGFRLYSNGKLKCEKCGVEDLFCLWNWECCADESKNNQKYDYSKIRNIFANAIGIDTRSVSPMFLIYVAACIDKQYQQHPERFV
jgi:hypothetical protein